MTVAAAASALSAILSPLLQSQQGIGTSKSTGTGFTASSFSVGDQSSTQIMSGDAIKGASTPSSAISPQTMSALIAAQSDSTATGGTTTTARSAQPKDPLADLFSLLDSDGDDKVNKSEFEKALGAGGTNLQKADDVFSKLDKDGDGNVSMAELGSALKGKGKHHHAPRAGGADALAAALKGATSTSTTNADGSTTTTLTYADGSKVTSTSAAAKSGTASVNALEKLIQQQAQMISSQASASGSALSVSA